MLYEDNVVYSYIRIYSLVYVHARLSRLQRRYMPKLSSDDVVNVFSL